MDGLKRSINSHKREFLSVLKRGERFTLTDTINITMFVVIKNEL